MPIGLSYVNPGFFGGLVDGIKDTMKMQNEAKALNQSMTGLRVKASERNLGIKDDGSMFTLGEDDAGYNPLLGSQQMFMKMMIEHLGKKFNAEDGTGAPLSSYTPAGVAAEYGGQGFGYMGAPGLQ